MTGHPRDEGEDVMRFSCHAIPQPSVDLLEYTADAEKDGVRLWLLGAKGELLERKRTGSAAASGV